MVRITFLRTPNIAFVLLQFKFLMMEYRYLTQCPCFIHLLPARSKCIFHNWLVECTKNKGEIGQNSRHGVLKITRLTCKYLALSRGYVCNIHKGLSVLVMNTHRLGNVFLRRDVLSSKVQIIELGRLASPCFG